MNCQLCEEKGKTQCSHDIPKYIGGTDKDGRHNLCEDCHKKYDKKHLKIFLEFVGEKFNEDCMWFEVKALQIEISKLKNLHSTFRDMAKQIKKEVFGDDSVS